MVVNLANLVLRPFLFVTSNGSVWEWYNTNGPSVPSSDLNFGPRNFQPIEDVKRVEMIMMKILFWCHHSEKLWQKWILDLHGFQLFYQLSGKILDTCKEKDYIDLTVSLLVERPKGQS